MTKEQLNIALAKRFASRSEQLSPDQIRLFDEAESMAVETEVAPQKTVAVAAHHRKPGGRKPLPERLPRIEVIHEIPAGDIGELDDPGGSVGATADQFDA